MSIKDLFGKTVKTVNVGAGDFAKDLEDNAAQSSNLEWTPPARGDANLLNALDAIKDDPRIAQANKEALKRMRESVPRLIGVAPARDVIPGLTEDMILHAGPPLTWERMAGAVKGAVIGALIFEGKAGNEEEATKLMEDGKIQLSPCHEHDAVGPMGGITSPSMPVFIIENSAFGNRGYCTMNEGPGQALRFGFFGESVVTRLGWMRDVLGPALGKAIEHAGGIDVKPIMAEAMHMGDELHNRNKAATSLFIRAIAPHLAKIGLPAEELADVIEFLSGVDHSFLNISMPSAKVILDAANGVPYSSLVTVMARNGTDFGIQISGLGKEWFVGPAQMIQGLYFSGYTEKDACPDVGDSAISETCGYGAFAMAAAMAIVQIIGGKAEDAVRYSKQMYAITMEENALLTIPVFNFRGTATGIDLLKVIETGVLPIINTGIAHKDAGVGQVGAGLVSPPWDCFEKALYAFAKAVGKN